MTKLNTIAALATFAVICGSGGSALADPYADEVVDLKRVTPGKTPKGKRLSTDADDKDNGRDATGKPDWRYGDFSTVTALGFDARGTSTTSDDEGGTLTLKFTDNMCMDGAGTDLRVYDAYRNSSSSGNESALIEVSNDGGRTFMVIGEVGPGAGTSGFEVDAEDTMAYFSHVRLTALDYAGSINVAGIDVDAVECLNPLDKREYAYHHDGCDVAAGREGVDVDSITVYSDEFSIYVLMNICDPEAAGKARHDKDDKYKYDKYAKYRVYIDYTGGKGNRRWSDDDDRWNDDDDDDRWSDEGEHDSKKFKKGKGREKHRNVGGPDTLAANAKCRDTADSVSIYEPYKQRQSGPGLFEAKGNQLVFEVDYIDLTKGAGVTAGSEVLVWVEAEGRRHIVDTVPTTESGDRCSRPQVASEVLEITLK